MDIYKVIIITFIITAIYDVILREISLRELFPSIKFIDSLKPYYESQTLLTVALVAGFVGAVTQIPIILTSKSICADFNILIFMSITFIISALAGFIMKWSKLFPCLDNTYYKSLGWKHAMITDGVSGLIVNMTLLAITGFVPIY